MNAMRKVSAIIPTFNEVNNIEEAIKSVNFADEIIVVDSFSTDNTIQIAEKMGARVLQHEYIHSAAQKNWTIPQASHEWIFILDADERVSEELKDEVIATLSQKYIAEEGFWIKRRNHFMEKEIKYSGWQRDKVIRLFRRDTCRYGNKHVHEEIETDGTVGMLKNTLTHYTFKSMEHFTRKMNQYAKWKAEELHAKGKTASVLEFIFKPPFRFFKNYVLDLGFLDGKRGMIISGLNAYTIFLRYAHLHALNKSKKNI